MKKVVFGLLFLVLVVSMVGSVSAKTYYQFSTNEEDFSLFIPDQIGSTNFFNISGNLNYYDESWKDDWTFNFRLYVGPSTCEFSNFMIKDNLNNEFTGINTICHYEDISQGIKSYSFDETIHLLKLEHKANSYLKDVRGELEGEFMMDLEVNETTSELISAHISFLATLDNETNQTQRISLLETWKEAITEIITNLVTTITSLITQVDNHETRIEVLENQTYPAVNVTSPYLKYLNYGTRKTMVCEYAKDNHLTKYKDLKINCNVTYKQYSYGERGYCKCVEIK